MAHYVETATATTGYAQGVAEAPERESIVKEYEWAITELQQVVDEFQSRLAPVLQPPDLGGPGDSTPMPEVSAVRARLHDLHSTTAALRGLLFRLEV